MKNLFKVAYKFQIRKKSTIVYGVMIALVFILVLFFSSYSKSAINFLNSDIYDSRDYNEFVIKGKGNCGGDEVVIHPDGTIEGSLEDDKENTQDVKDEYLITTLEDADKLKEELYKIDHVANILNIFAYWDVISSDEFKGNGLDGNVEIYAANNKSLPEIVYGTNFPDEDGNYMICPENFYPTSDIYSNNYITSFSKINIKKYLNKKVKFNYLSRWNTQKFDIEFEIVGFYKNNKTHYDEDSCYIPNNAFKRMAKNIWVDDVDKETGISNIYIQTILFLQVDEAKNVEFVKKELDNMNVCYLPTTVVEPSSIINVQNNMEKYVKVTFLLLVITLIIIFRIQFENDIKKYRLLSYLGYKKSQIVIINTFSILIQFVLSIIISLIVLLAFGLLANYILDIFPFLFNKWRVIVDFNSVMYIPFMILISMIISVLYSVYRLRVEFNEVYDI